MRKYIFKVYSYASILSLFLVFCFSNNMVAAKLMTSSDQEVFYHSPEDLDEDVYVEVTKTEDTGVDLNIESESVILIEGSTGKLLYEKEKDKKLKPASVTKVMTLLLIFEALEAEQIKLSDEVTVSEHAASMGGSQVYLEPNEVQSVDTMIKCISISSANDASVAMAELLAGSEEEFVIRMNKRAKELGMNNTNFVNCTGLDADNHYTTANDISLMSKELVVKYPQISSYATTWMDTFVHRTKKGESEFGLSNTNKLIKSYNGITGLKTGSTSLAKYCLSATARRDDMDLIAVILAAPDTKTRFREAAKLLNYGFANYGIYKDDNSDLVIEPILVARGEKSTVNGKVEGEFSYLCEKGMNKGDIRKEVVISEGIKAPILENDVLGEIKYFYGDKEIGNIKILASNAVDKAGFGDYFGTVLKKFFIRNDE